MGAGSSTAKRSSSSATACQKGFSIQFGWRSQKAPEVSRTPLRVPLYSPTMASESAFCSVKPCMREPVLQSSGLVVL